MKRYAFIAAGFLLVMVGSEQGRAQMSPRRALQDPTFQAPLGVNCWTETQPFSSLRTGAVNFCKKHMKYAPGALDCSTFETEICEIFQPTTQQWTQNRRPLRPRVIECPEEIEPPLCPSNPTLRW